MTELNQGEQPTTTGASQENATQGAPAEKTFTQAELDAIVGDRLKRERAKYADYKDLQAKAAAYDEQQEASKSELEKACELRDSYKAELDKLKEEQAHAAEVAKVAAETGVSAALLSRMSGDVEENAAFLRQQAESRPKYGAVRDGGEANVPHRSSDIPKIF